jgi:aspartate/methionine/tyrosine aminotransferase
LTNPHNPLGVIYQPSVIRSCIEWARTAEMHTIVDEIYALSIHVSFVIAIGTKGSVAKNSMW